MSSWMNVYKNTSHQPETGKDGSHGAKTISLLTEASLTDGSVSREKREGKHQIALKRRVSTKTIPQETLWGQRLYASF